MKNGASGLDTRKRRFSYLFKVLSRGNRAGADSEDS